MSSSSGLGGLPSASAAAAGAPPPPPLPHSSPFSSPTPGGPRCALSACHAELIGRFLRCGGCRLVHYCSPDHQAADWPAHRDACQAEQARLEAVARTSALVVRVPSFSERWLEAVAAAATAATAVVAAAAAVADAAETKLAAGAAAAAVAAAAGAAAAAVAAAAAPPAPPAAAAAAAVAFSATLSCSICGEGKLRLAFSAKQLGRGDARRCRACVDASNAQLQEVPLDPYNGTSRNASRY